MKIFLIAFLFALPVYAAELAGVKLDDKATVEGQELILNGIGLRKVVRFGFPIKVYVGGLYTPKKSADADEIIKMKSVRQVVMQFLLAVDRENLIDAFDGSFKGNCVLDCEKKSEQYAQLKVHVAPMRKGDQMIFTALPDKLIFEIKGANAKRIEIPGAAISANVIAMFINKTAPPTPELRTGLLGL
jgi:hypothetical protein